MHWLDHTDTSQCGFKTGAKANDLNICTLICNTTLNLYNVSSWNKRFYAKLTRPVATVPRPEIENTSLRESNVKAAFRNR